MIACNIRKLLSDFNKQEYRSVKIKLSIKVLNQFSAVNSLSTDISSSPVNKNFKNCILMLTIHESSYLHFLFSIISQFSGCIIETTSFSYHYSAIIFLPEAPTKCAQNFKSNMNAKAIIGDSHLTF